MQKKFLRGAFLTMSSISNETPYSLLSGSAYSDTITNTGHHVTIYGYATRATIQSSTQTAAGL